MAKASIKLLCVTSLMCLWPLKDILSKLPLCNILNMSDMSRDASWICSRHTKNKIFNCTFDNYPNSNVVMLILCRYNSANQLCGSSASLSKWPRYRTPPHLPLLGNIVTSYLLSSYWNNKSKTSPAWALRLKDVFISNMHIHEFPFF